VPDLPTTPRGAATSRRILDAAAEEFAARGIAGARVDRIVAAARTNKAQVYGYFGSKEGLFDAVLADLLTSAADAVPFGAADLPGWAVAMYDENLRHPNLIRLMTWSRLEMRVTGLLFGNLGHGPKLAATAAAQEAGLLKAGDPADLLALVAGMASAWSPASAAYTAGADEPAAVHERRRELLRDSVRRAVAP
jgi:AcrR family transcriptional regulator